MSSTNDFETAADLKNLLGYKVVYSQDANTHYRYSDAQSLLENTNVITKMIQHHKEHQVPRLQNLQEYYKGHNTSILRAKRRKEEHLADHRATHNFAKYISQFIQGYMVGVPLKTTYPVEEMNTKLRDINRLNDADEHNSDLILDCSIYGRAYELLYRNRFDETRFTVTDVMNTFVIYDNTVEMNPIAAVRYINTGFEKEELTVYVYTDVRMFTFEVRDTQSMKLIIEKEEEHFFDGVPVVEYQNNKFRQGDFEDVVSLIDLYDEAQSDTSNYMTDFNDAMLKITGNLDIDPEKAKKMKEHNILLLQTEPDGEGRHSAADADYIYKQYDVAGTEAYKGRVFNDILLFSTVPNLLDDHFSGNSSGEALKMKLFGLSQKRAIKERLFKKSLRDRYRLISNIMSRASEGEFNVNDLSIVFTENIPKAIDKELKWFADLGGELSSKTLLSMLSFVENPQEELDRIKKEQESRVPAYDFQQVQNAQQQDGDGTSDDE